MGVRTQDIFGDSNNPQPAVPGSYGEAPQGRRLPDATRLGPVHLQIVDIDRSLAFYQGVLGLRAIRREASHVVLAPNADDTPLVELHEHPSARPAPRRGGLGLYHFAILLPDRASLGQFMHHLGDIGARAGSADHLVSEAFYLQDPDNLGIEVYADRPRSAWRRVGRQLMMATDPIDIAGLGSAAGNGSWGGMPAATAIGHVHLHVGDIAKAASFFSDAIGFDRTVWHYPGALFLGAGGYHHHLGANTWAGPGARPPADDDARLLEWTIELPNADSMLDVEENFARAGHPVERVGSPAATELVARDPWGTQLRIRLSRPRERSSA